MLLQKHAHKAHHEQEPAYEQFPGLLNYWPADRVPALPGYEQKANSGFKGEKMCFQGGYDSPSGPSECMQRCDSNPDCSGFELPSMGLLVPEGQRVSYYCYFACPDGRLYASNQSYAYYKKDFSTTTTTSSTLYIYKPYECSTGRGNIAEQCSWSVPQKQYCCTNNRLCDGLVEANCKVGAEDDPHITSVQGHKFDLYKAGTHDFLVIPEGATPETADLHLSGKVRKIGKRENDLWIRKLKVQGKWVKNGPYEFKTSNAHFGKKKSALIRQGASKSWVPMDHAKLDGSLHLASAVDKKAPEADFAQSVSKSLVLKAGPLRVNIDWATAQKNGEDINHLDLHVKGLHSMHKKSIGGLLAGNVSALQMMK